MKKNSLGVGLVFIFIGVVIIAWQLKVLDLSFINSVFGFVFRNLTEVISMILIVIGLNIIFRKYRFVKVITWVAFFAVIIALSQLYPLKSKGLFILRDEVSENGNYENGDGENRNYFEINKEEDTLYGELDINLGMVKINVDSTDDKLIKGEIRGINFKEPVINYKEGNKKAKIKIKAPDIKNLLNVENIKDGNLDLFLNKDVLWDIDLNLGMVDTEFDTSDLQVKELNLNGGAGNFKLIIGERQKEIEIEVNAGASNVEIYVPKNSGVKVKNTGVLSTMEFNGIKAVKDGKHYISENYDDAENKIKIDVKMGAGNVSINAK
ncbi:LiaF domain-containing protein [Acetivibrio saccincola]|uniref:Cell wall-active antibiotics response LiaF-like C-terminal domain-containing protein n=1 Tax=Acetivibrio saccincola TaxID=1677857 RepID=A0A2S8RB52_9FIRM|nr:LiaF domain-containing protein [Acetivibrio saccincola]PQQ67018.1 hypothetical protein B9R14_09895 [Acetivibrio saccincola]